MEYDLNNLNNMCFKANISYELRDLISNILDRIEEPYDYDDVMQAIDDSIIYFEDQWLILKEYCNPTEANWYYAIESFTQDVWNIIQELEKGGE